MTTSSEQARLSEAIAVKPRVSLGHFPTPLEDAPRLSERLGLRVLIKRDDQTGLALGGNKVRKLEFLIGDALKKGADTILTTGGSQSNHARLTAAACRRFSLDCVLVLDRGIHPECQGNVILDALFAAEICMIESPDPAVADKEMRILAAELESAGRHPYVIPRGGSVPVGATGYAAFVVELLDQLNAQQIVIDALYLGTGSRGTHSGLLAGVAASTAPFRVEGISVSHPEDVQRRKVLELSNATLEHLGIARKVTEEHVHVDGSYRGPGYGIPTDETMEAVKVAALDEGLVLDPVYTGKAMAGLIGHARDGRLSSSDTVIFVHTGGAPALFAYASETAEALAG